MSQKTEKLQAHGLTAEDLNQIQYRQTQGEVMATAGENNPHGIPEHERHLVHVKIELVEYDRQTGQKTSTPRTQSFTEAEFKQVKDSGILDGYSVEILSSPADFKVTAGELKKELTTGPLLGQPATATGPEGSVATTAGETLLQTTGSLEPAKVETEVTNQEDAEKENAGDNTPDPNEAPIQVAAPKNLSPKEAKRAQYKEAFGTDAPADFTMAQLAEAIDNKGK